MKKMILAAMLLMHQPAMLQAQTITTIAGTDSAGYNGDNIQATTARLNHPALMTISADGEVIFADPMNNRIRKISSAGIITTIAGTGIGGYNGDNQPATSADLYIPVGVAVNAAGELFIADDYGSRIRRVDNAGIITTVAGNGTYGYSGDNGAATAAEINSPHGIAVDGAGNIYFADYNNNRIRKIDVTGIISTIAGGGTAGPGDGGMATAARLIQPYGVAIDNAGNIYLSEPTSARIRKIDGFGIISTVAGTGGPGFSGDGGPATNAKLSTPMGLALDDHGNLYVCEVTNNRVRKVSTGGMIHTIAGTGIAASTGDGGPATEAALDNPLGITVAHTGEIYVAEVGSSKIRRIQSTVHLEMATQRQQDLSIYPNPSSGQFVVEFKTPNVQNVVYKIFDLLGQPILEISSVTNQETKIDIQKSGIYIINATSDHTEHFVKVHILNR